MNVSTIGRVTQGSRQKIYRNKSPHLSNLANGIWIRQRQPSMPMTSRRLTHFSTLPSSESRHVRHEIVEDQILRRIVRTYSEFLVAFGKDDGMSFDKIRNEIDSHKEWVARQRRIFKERVNEIDQTRKTKQEDEKVLKIYYVSQMMFTITYLHYKEEIFFEYIIIESSCACADYRIVNIRVSVLE